jgi:ABC-type uncharacterized transport system fused permease/ATPase subunit
MDLASEAAMYSLLDTLPDCTYLSVGHRPSLQAFHTKQMRLQGPGTQPEVTDILSPAPQKEEDRAE